MAGAPVGGKLAIGVFVSGGWPGTWPGTLAATIIVAVVAVGGWPGRCVITVLSWACTMTLCWDGGEEVGGIPAEVGKEGGSKRERESWGEASNNVDVHSAWQRIPGC